MFLNYLVSLPIVDLSYALAFVMSLKTFSSINSAIAIHKFQEKGLKKKLARTGLQSEDWIRKWNTDTDTNIEVVD